MVSITQKFLTMGAQHGRTGAPLNPKGIVVHYVGNPGSPAMGNRDYFESGSGGNGVSAHYIVGLKGEIIQCIPENEQAMHAGKPYDKKYDETAKYNNSKYIGIENCHEYASGKFNESTYNSLIALATDICIRYKLEISSVFRHYDVAGKICPKYYVDYPGEWDKFKRDLANSISKALGNTQIINPSAKPAVEQLKTWARAKNASETFVSLAAKYVSYAPQCGNVDACIAYCQAAKETGFGRFGGVLDESFHNPCGMKTAQGGGDYDRYAHQAFNSWDEGVMAHLDHLALYAGAAGYPKKDTSDPRHFPSLYGTAKTVEALGGKWAGSLYYGYEIAQMLATLQNTTVASAESKLLELIKDSSINSPQYWIGALTSFKYFDGFVSALYDKYVVVK